MKALKQTIIDDLLARINASPYLIVTDYAGTTVSQFDDLRGKLAEVGAGCHITKNSYIKRAAKDAELPGELNEHLVGQSAIVTGESDICAAARVLKDFHKIHGKPVLKGGALDGKALSLEEVNMLASLPPRDVLLAQLLGVLQAPAQKLVRLLNEPAASLARVLAAREDQG